MALLSAGLLYFVFVMMRRHRRSLAKRRARAASFLERDLSYRTIRGDPTSWGEYRAIREDHSPPVHFHRVMEFDWEGFCTRYLRQFSVAFPGSSPVRFQLVDQGAGTWRESLSQILRNTSAEPLRPLHSAVELRDDALAADFTLYASDSGAANELLANADLSEAIRRFENLDLRLLDDEVQYRDRGGAEVTRRLAALPREEWHPHSERSLAVIRRYHDDIADLLAAVVRALPDDSSANRRIATQAGASDSDAVLGC